MSEEGTPSKKELRAQRKQAKRLEKEKRNLLTVSENCKGCGAYMSLDQRFCSGCGAKRMYNRLNLRNLGEDFTDRFLNVENNFFKTFIDLFRNPKDVIDGYINGVRKKHLSAFSYFAISITVVGFYTFIFKQWFLDDLIASGSGINVDVNGEIVRESAQEINRQLFEWIFDNQSLFNFLNIPLYAIVSWLVFWNYKKYNLIEHIVIYLYTYSHTQIVSSILGVLFFWSPDAQMVIGVLILVLSFVYTAYVLYQLFDLTIDKLILKTLLFSLIFGVVTVLFFGIVGFLVYKFGLMDDFIEQMKEFSIQEGKRIKAQKMINDSIRMDSIKRATRIVQDTIPQVIIDTTKTIVNYGASN